MLRTVQMPDLSVSHKQVVQAMDLDVDLQGLLVSFERLVTEALCLVHVSNIDQSSGHLWVFRAKHSDTGLECLLVHLECL